MSSGNCPKIVDIRVSGKRGSSGHTTAEFGKHWCCKGERVGILTCQDYVASRDVKRLHCMTQPVYVKCPSVWEVVAATQLDDHGVCRAELPYTTGRTRSDFIRDHRP